MDATDKPVVTEITWANKTMPIVPSRPAFPRTQPKRWYMITPRIVKIEGVNTPKNMPYFFWMAACGDDSTA